MIPPMLRIRELRDAEGWSLKELERRSGVDRGTIWRVEQGRQSPSVDKAAALAKALGVSLDELHVPEVDSPDAARAENADARGDSLAAAGAEGG